jgi:hypothetical protein
MRLFGRVALALGIPAVALEGFLLYHYVTTGSLTPHKWAGFVGLGLALLAVEAFRMGLVGGMLDRHRLYLEEVLYRLRSGELTGRPLPPQGGESPPADETDE